MTSAVHGPQGNGTDDISTWFAVRDDTKDAAYKNSECVDLKKISIMQRYNSRKVNNNFILHRSVASPTICQATQIYSCSLTVKTTISKVSKTE